MPLRALASLNNPCSADAMDRRPEGFRWAWSSTEGNGRTRATAAFGRLRSVVSRRTFSQTGQG